MEELEYTTSMELIYERPHTVILNGFDRSGSSAISKVLATHPEIELFMQPFNSGPVRKKMNVIWDEATATAVDVEFFRGLERGEIIPSYIKSHWFEKHSTAQAFVPGKIHIIKTTINHLLIDWTQRNFPGIDHWVIWRNPMDILASMVRNDVIDAWYGEALTELTPTIHGQQALDQRFGQFISRVDHPHSRAALIISVRTWCLFSMANPLRVIDYESFRKDNHAGLLPFLDYYSLSSEITSNRNDLNISGQRFELEKDHRRMVDPNELDLIQEIFLLIEAFRPISQ